MTNKEKLETVVIQIEETNERHRGERQTLSENQSRESKRLYDERNRLWEALSPSEEENEKSKLIQVLVRNPMSQPGIRRILLRELRKLTLVELRGRVDEVNQE